MFSSLVFTRHQRCILTHSSFDNASMWLLNHYGGRSVISLMEKRFCSTARSDPAESGTRQNPKSSADLRGRKVCYYEKNRDNPGIAADRIRRIVTTRSFGCSNAAQRFAGNLIVMSRERDCHACDKRKPFRKALQPLRRDINFRSDHTLWSRRSRAGL